jgi:hypothetical protein
MRLNTERITASDSSNSTVTISVWIDLLSCSVRLVKSWTLVGVRKIPDFDSHVYDIGSVSNIH